MTDKELIKQEIERRISQFEAKYPKDLGGYWKDEESDAYACVEEYKSFLLFIDSLPEEPVSEDLEDAAYHFCLSEFGNPKEPLFEFDQRCYIAGALWQKQKDKQLVGATQKISHQHGYDEGRLDMMEEMMKTLVEGEIVKDIHNQLKVTSEPLNDTFVKFGDKVKIIIVKED